MSTTRGVNTYRHIFQCFFELLGTPSPNNISYPTSRRKTSAARTTCTQSATTKKPHVNRRAFKSSALYFL